MSSHMSHSRSTKLSLCARGVACQALSSRLDGQLEERQILSSDSFELLMQLYKCNYCMHDGNPAMEVASLMAASPPNTSDPFQFQSPAHVKTRRTNSHVRGSFHQVVGVIVSVEIELELD